MAIFGRWIISWELWMFMETLFSWRSNVPCETEWGILEVVDSSSEYEKASENNNIVFLLLFGVSQSLINILLLYIACTVLFQPTSLTTGIYWPPSTAKVLHISKFLTDILQTWCHDTHKNITNFSEKITFILNWD